MYDQSRLDRLILSILLFLIFLFLITIIISCEGSQKDNLFLNNNNQSKLLDQILQMNKDDNSNNKNDNKNKFNQIFLSNVAPDPIDAEDILNNDNLKESQNQHEEEQNQQEETQSQQEEPQSQQEETQSQQEEMLDQLETDGCSCF